MITVFRSAGTITAYAANDAPPIASDRIPDNYSAVGNRSQETSNVPLYGRQTAEFQPKPQAVYDKSTKQLPGWFSYSSETVFAPV